MSQTQPQQQPKSETPPARSGITHIVFRDAVTFAGSIMMAKSEPGLAAVGRTGFGVEITPVKVTATGLRELRDGDTFDGYRLRRRFMDRTGAKPVERTETAFVPESNIKDVTYAE